MTRTPKEVLLVAHQYWPTAGAASQRLTRLVEEVVATGAVVTVLSQPGPGDPSRELVGPSGERVVRVGGMEGSGGVVRRSYSVLSFALGTLRAGWRSTRFDLIISDPPPTAAAAAALLARRHGSVFCFYFADSWGAVAAQSKTGVVRQMAVWFEKIERAVLRRADLVVSVTTSLHRVAGLVGGGRSLLRPNGAPLDVFRPDGEVWLPSAAPFFLYAGNAGEAHGAEIFALAAEVLWGEGAEFDLVYMGYGSGRAAIDEVADRWPGRVYRLPNCPPEQVAAAYRGAVGALSSLRIAGAYADARPIKSITGLACGCPPVYAGGGAFADELRDAELGFVGPWEVGSVRASMAAALEVHHDPLTSSRIRKRCSQYARANFDNRAVAKDLATRLVAICR